LGRPDILANINRFPLPPNQWLFPRCPVSTRGAYRDRHEREAGCGGREASARKVAAGRGKPVSGSRRAGRTTPMRTAKPCGPDTRSWCQAAGGEFDPTGSMRHQAGSDGGKTNSSPGRARHKPSSHCAGNAGVFRLYLYARVRISMHTLHTRPRVQRAPGIPCTFRFRKEGTSSCKPRAQCVARMRNCICVRWVERSETHHSPRGLDGYRFAPPILRTSRHCERSEAIHSFFAPRGGLLRCARNDVERPRRTGYPRMCGV
jgi:hypothetical protein